MSTTASQCPTSDQLERFALDDRPDPGVLAHLEQCDACREATARIRDDNRFLGRFAAHGSLPDPLAPPPPADVVIPGYDLLGEVHRGGQGVVYRAVQRSTQRHVALKTTRQGPFATLADRARFAREIETLGRLRHSNIVTVHDAGEIGGVQYFVMDYVEGLPLDQAMAADLPPPAPPSGSRHADSASRSAPHPRPLPPRIARIIDTVAKVCDAVHAAHLRGVMHRDLKPSNIRVDAAGEPHVLDFGLAKLAGAAHDSMMTRTGQFVGSLPWASPEQIEGDPDRVDLRTDVYSLGVILFQLLTGELPFDVGSSLRDALDDVLRREPPAPSAVLSTAGKGRLDEELDTIVLKCLAKDRARRYQGADDLARDLRRYRAGEPIEAKRDSALYLLRKTMRRYRRRVAASLAAAVVLSALLIIVAALYRRSLLLEADALRAARSLAAALADSNIEQGRTLALVGNIPQAEKLLWRELLLAPAPDGDRKLNEPPGPPHAFWALWELYRAGPCLRTLSQPGGLHHVAILDTRDGRGVWQADASGNVRCLDEFGALRERYRVEGCTASPVPDGRGEFTYEYSPGRLTVRARDNPVAHVIDADCFSYCTDPPSFVIATGPRIELRASRDAALMLKIEVPDTAIAAVALSADAALLAARDRAGAIHVWRTSDKSEVTRGAPAADLPGATATTGPLAFSPSGRFLGDGRMEAAGRIWNLDTRPATEIPLSERAGDGRTMQFSPDESLLAVSDVGGALRLFSTRDGRLVDRFIADEERLRSVAFTRDGDALWTAGGSHTRLWEVRRDAGVRHLSIGADMLHSLDVAPGGLELAVGAARASLVTLDLLTGQLTPLPIGGDGAVSSVVFAADGRRLAATTYSEEALIWALDRPGDPPLRLPHPARVSDCAFLPDMRRLATAGDDMVVRVWDVAKGGLLRELRGPRDRMPQLAVSPRDERIVAVVRDGAMIEWRADSDEPIHWQPPSGVPLRAVQFSSDGTRIVTGGAERCVRVWDALTRRTIREFTGHPQQIFCLDLSPNDEMIASGDSGGSIRLWHLPTGRFLATLDGHRGAIMSLRFSPDGRTLYSACIDGSVRAWDLTYHHRHIAGQVHVQLQNLGIPGNDPRAAAWRDWADRHMNPAPAPALSAAPTPAAR